MRYLQAAGGLPNIEALASRARVIEIDRELEARLQRSPDATLVRSLPGMGTALTAEPIAVVGSLARFRSADALASEVGIPPVLRRSRKTRFLHLPVGGDKGLKRVFCRSAFCSLGHQDSRAFDRKRREAKRYHQAVARARRRANVLWAIIHSRTSFQAGFKTAA